MQEPTPEILSEKDVVVPSPEGGPSLSVPTKSVEKRVERGVEGVVSSVVSQDDPQEGPSPKAYLSWDGMSSQVSRLLGFGKSKTVKIPSIKVQQTRVAHALEKEILKLRKQSERMMRRSTFSADKYESLVLEIRRFRAMLFELYTVTKETLQQWYRQYVLKVV